MTRSGGSAAAAMATGTSHALALGPTPADQTSMQPNSTTSTSASPAPSPSSAAVAAAMASPSAVRRLSSGGTGGGAATGPTTRSKTGRPSSKFGTVNYSVDEMRRLNAKVRLVMPVVGEDWLHVAYQFNYMRPESIPYREVESLKRKFKKMYCSRASAGGKMPSYVAEAKELRHLINQRTERAQLEQQSDTHSEMDTHSEHHSHSGSATTSIGVLEDAQRLKDEAQNSVARAATRVTADGQAVVDDPYAPGTTDSGMPVDLDSERLDGSEDLYCSTRESPKDAMDTAGLSSSYEEQQKHTQQPRPSDASSAMSLQGVAMNDSDAEEDTRDLSAKLSQMEEEYHRTMRAKRTSSESIDMVSNTVATSTSALTSPTELAAATAQSLPSTSGIINMLKHSIERKRRTIEEQMLSESERVRKERKKRKMEQVLYAIHQEHRELLGSGTADLTATPLLAGTPTSPRQFAAVSHGGAATSSSASFTAASSIPRFMQDSSLSSMEIMLQYMIAQQEEMTRRYELEKEQRRKEQAEREVRRREKETQRRQERKELMLALAALLGDKFPDALKYHLFDPSAVDDEQQATEAAETDSRRARLPGDVAADVAEEEGPL